MSTRGIFARFLPFLALSVVALGLSACGGADARKARHLQNGQTFLNDGKFEKARVEFQNALQIAPADPQARFEMGVVDEKLNKVREAAQFYQSAIDVSPDHFRARSKLARLYVFSGVPDRALELLKPAIEKQPEDSELLAIRAAARVQLKDISGGQVDAEHAVQLDPKNEDAVATLAGIYISTNAVDKAQALLEKSVAGLPATVDLRLALAQVYSREKRTADSERILLDLVRMRPDEQAHRIRLAQFYASQNQLDAAEQALRDGIKAIPQDRQLKLSLVEFLASRRSQDAAEKELKAMIAADPKDFEMQFALAKLFQTSARPALAEATYQEVIVREKLDAAGLAARDRLAELRAQRNDSKGAEALIGEVLAKSPRDDDALVLRGDIALANKNPKSAIADLRTVLRDQPNAIGVLRTLARAHLANGEPAIAEETMRRAVEANPKDASIRLDLAQLLAQLGKPEQAKPIVADLVKEQPNNIPALNTLFRVSAATKDYAAATSAAEAIVATQPKSAMGYFYEGMMAETAKLDDDQALKLYAQAVELQPNGIEPLQAELRLLVRLRRIPDALKRLDDLTARYPDNALASDLKGGLLLSLGRATEAQEAFKTAIARAPKFWTSYRGLAFAQFESKDPDAAVATLQKGILVVDEPDRLGIEIAGYYASVGKTEEAIHQYEEVVSRSPDSEAAANNLAMLLVTYKKDRVSLDRAKALTARFAESPNLSYLDTYGWVLYKLGETAASVPVLERVVSKAPNAPEALYHLGMAQSQAGSNVQARDNLSRAVQSGAKFSGLDEAKATLDKLAKLPSSSAPKT